MHAVSVGEESVYLPAPDFLHGVVVVLEYDAHGVDVVDFLKRHLLGLHLVVDAVCAFHAGLDFISESGCVELLAHRAHELLHDFLPVFLALLHLGHDFGVFLRMLVFEGEVFEFLLYREQSEAMGERSVHVERLPRDFVLLFGAHGAEGAHVVQTVGHLD